MPKKILITAALPYANGPLHFGHIAGAYLPADCYARFQRLRDNQVLYICGSDEYGVAITMSAEMAGRTPKEHVDIFHKINKDFFDRLGISFDHYSRTTWPGHKEPTVEFFRDLMQNGYIEEKVTEQLYSEVDQKFLADRYVVGTCPKCGFEEARGDECQKCGASYEAIDLLHPCSKLTGAPLVRRATKHWFLLLDKMKERVSEWFEHKKWKPNVENFARSYLADLRPRAITRDSSWGVPVPVDGADGKVLYVWFDAPIGYISATKEWAELQGNPEAWKDYWLDEKTKLVQFIGKDNIPFHALIFPAMTMGQNEPYKLVDELPANEFFNLEGRQFSKSDGWFIDLEDFFKKYTPDQIRYTIAANAPESADAEFTWKDFQQRCNADLLGKYGNFVNRVLVFLKNHCGGEVPAKAEMEEIDLEFLKTIHRLVQEAAESFETFKVRRASQLVMELAQAGNVYFDAKKPWQDAKQPALRGRLQTTIASCLECLKCLALISLPIIPKTADHVWSLLGFETSLQELTWDSIVALSYSPGTKLPEPSILFQRIEDVQIEEEKSKLQALSDSVKKAKQPSYLPLKKEVDFDCFTAIDLRVGLILEVKPVPKSKKLLQLLVDLGFEKRVIVSGISQHYAPEALIGKKVAVVANLKPAVLMGIQSEGMLLAGSLDSAFELLSIQNLPPGSVIC